jgi:hypothetical protein
VEISLFIPLVHAAKSFENWEPREVVLRGRANQDHGASLDQLSFDYTISPALGMRVGLLDYRATWCRVYDLDNPWVRENDPFCSDKDVTQATDSAPALQTYVQFNWSDYRVQGVAGLYRPMAFGYEKREFSNFILPETATITKNQKHAVSLNFLNMQTSTEWRFSWIGARQSLFESDFIQLENPDFFPATQLNYHQKVNTYFAGVSWQAAAQLRARLTYFTSHLKARCELLNPAAGPPCSNTFDRNSVSMELNYQLNPSDVVSLAASNYTVDQKNVYQARNKSLSLAWRRDWSAGWFGAVQLIHTNVSVPYNNDSGSVPYSVGKSRAWGAGVRLGYVM